MFCFRGKKSPELDTPAIEKRFAYTFLQKLITYVDQAHHHMMEFGKALLITNDGAIFTNMLVFREKRSVTKKTTTRWCHLNSYLTSELNLSLKSTAGFVELWSKFCSIIVQQRSHFVNGKLIKCNPEIGTEKLHQTKVFR